MAEGKSRRSGGPAGTEHKFERDPDEVGSLSTAVASAIAEVEGTDVTSLGFALHDYVDTDALDAILAPKLDGTAREGSRIEFTVPGYAVTVGSDDTIVVTDLREAAST